VLLQPLVHPRRITHAVLETEDVEQLVEFYGRVAGLRVVARKRNVIVPSAERLMGMRK
jgi:hypothetical protein